MNTGDKIKYLRKSQNMSQEILANKLRINRNFLSRIETGKSEPTASILKNLSSIFGVSISSILDIEKNSPVHEDKIKYINDNCKLLSESDIDFIVKIISIMKEEYVKKK